MVSWKLCMARPSCFRLFKQRVRDADSRVFLAAAVIVGAVALIIRAGGEEETGLAPEDADLGCTKEPETLHA